MRCQSRRSRSRRRRGDRASAGCGRSSSRSRAVSWRRGSRSGCGQNLRQEYHTIRRVRIIFERKHDPRLSTIIHVRPVGATADLARVSVAHHDASTAGSDDSSIGDCITAVCSLMLASNPSNRSRNTYSIRHCTRQRQRYGRLSRKQTCTVQPPFEQRIVTML